MLHNILRCESDGSGHLFSSEHNLFSDTQPSLESLKDMTLIINQFFNEK